MAKIENFFFFQFKKKKKKKKKIEIYKKRSVMG